LTDDRKDYERYPAYYPEGVPNNEGLEQKPEFRRSKLTYFTLFFLLVIWPAMSLIAVDDPVAMLEKLSLSPILFVYIPTIISQWLLFALVFLTVYRERTGLRGIGFKKIRPIDFLWAVAFLLVSNVILAGLSLVLSWINIEIPGELGLILPKNNTERILWVVLSLTAAVCEETAFRGYLLTRIKIVSHSGGWILPVVLSSFSFGVGHTYQGMGGFILLSIYGALFALLYIRTGTIWPAIIAHFFQDFSALFYPYQP